MRKILLVWMMLGSSALGADFKAGLARRSITPTLPIWMSGYAARIRPADGVVLDLWAKALAIEDNRGSRVVIVTTDLIGLPREISDAVAVRVEKQFGLGRARLLLNSSHTHTGPVVWPGIRVMFNLTPEDYRLAELYARKLTDDLVAVTGDALHDLAPAVIRVAHGTCGFASNRRQPSQGGFRIGVNAAGPVDPDVPVLEVTGKDGNIRALLFGYACHNTTLGADFYQITGDYAGFAQAEIEKRHPGATAMFLMLCGADQNPNPRGTLDLARSHGQSLADAVEHILAGRLTTVRPPLRAAYSTVGLEFAPHERKSFEQEALSTDAFRQRRAKLMLKAYDEGDPERSVVYPIQGIRFNKDLTILALGGEVVVDYALRIKREYPRENMIVAGYSNDVMGYIPSLRVLKEGGYEPVDSMIYYGHPGPFSEKVEDSVMGAVRQVLRKLGARH
ncbi:MAG TPA: neutral/alkaline non-lysosomal ceramidase N-terminal domain-containing protein [Acidobacteriota bacterium]|nr:neutral/alkaline non-lysosomal ceramidase N-terminal domain-containing protein [Acidobacteriota bacterium]